MGGIREGMRAAAAVPVKLEERLLSKPDRSWQGFAPTGALAGLHILKPKPSSLVGRGRAIASMVAWLYIILRVRVVRFFSSFFIFLGLGRRCI